MAGRRTATGKAELLAGYAAPCQALPIPPLCHRGRHNMNAGDRLRGALDEKRAGVEAALREAEAELAALQERQAELLGLIARARAMLGEPHTPDPERATLHEAIALLLREQGNRWMTVNELAAEVNRRVLYRKRDGTAVEPNQIHARTKAYQSRFEKDGPRVRLRDAPWSA